MDWEVLYTIGKLLERRCLKWLCMTHLNIKNTSYNQKKGWESNCEFNSRPLKVKNRLHFCVCRWHVTYHWKAFDEGYNFSLDLKSIGGLHVKLWAFKVVGVLTWEFRNFHLGVSKQNAIWMLVLWPVTEYTIKGRWWLLQVWAVVSLVNLVSPSCRGSS
jgi:hypothetical protein